MSRGEHDALPIWVRPAPGERKPAHSREQIVETARRTRRVFTTHEWIVEHLGDGDQGPAGPNAMRHIEQSLEVAARTGVGVEEQLELVALVDDYVFGHAIRARESTQAMGDEGFAAKLEAAQAYLETQLATGEFPHLRELFGDDAGGRLARLPQ